MHTPARLGISDILYWSWLSFYRSTFFVSQCRAHDIHNSPLTILGHVGVCVCQQKRYQNSTTEAGDKSSSHTIQYNKRSVADEGNSTCRLISSAFDQPHVPPVMRTLKQTIKRDDVCHLPVSRSYMAHFDQRAILNFQQW